MLSSYTESSNVGIDISCVDINMSWEPTTSIINEYTNKGINIDVVKNTWKKNSKFYLKVVKYEDDLIPKAYLLKSSQLFSANQNPYWNTRKIFRFRFHHIQHSYIKEFIAQLTDEDIREPNYICFRIVYFKVQGGGNNIFYPIRASKNGSIDVGLGDNNRMNINKNSFSIKDGGILPYVLDKTTLVWLFFFGYNVKSDVWTSEFKPSENKNSNQILRNALYTNYYSYEIGHTYNLIEDIFFQPLIEPLDTITITNVKQYSFVSFKKSHNTGGNELINIQANDLSRHYLKFTTTEPTVNQEIELDIMSRDYLYKRYVVKRKEIDGETFIVNNIRSGLAEELYKFNLTIIYFKVVNDADKRHSIIAQDAILGYTYYNIKILPEEALADFEPVLYFKLLNNSPHAISIKTLNGQFISENTGLVFPLLNSLGEKTQPRFEVRSTGEVRDIDEFEITIEVITENVFYKSLIPILPLTVNVANLYVNYNYLLIDIYDRDNIIKSNDVKVMPRRYEDITKSVVINHEVIPGSGDSVTYNFTVVVENNKFVITNPLTSASWEYADIMGKETDILSNLKQNDILYFDTSDSSNFGHRLSFFTTNNTSAFELRNENNSILAEYSRYYPQGTPGSYVRITLPRDRTTIYYRTNPFNSVTNYVVYGYGTINFNVLEFKEIGTFTITDISSNPQQGGGSIDLSNNGILGNIDLVLRVDDDLFGAQNLGSVFVRTIAVSPPLNLSYYIENDTHLNLEWDVEEVGRKKYFFDNDYSINISYEILRQGYSETGEEVYEIIGVSEGNNTTYIDITTERFTNYNYKVRTLITWKEAVVRSSPSDELFVFICENNAFADVGGRWNNTTSNRKLYKKLDNNCINVNKLVSGYSRSSKSHPGAPTALTTNLFPNSKELTRSERYALLSRANSRPQR